MYVGVSIARFLPDLVLGLSCLREVCTLVVSDLLWVLQVGLALQASFGIRCVSEMYLGPGIREGKLPVTSSYLSQEYCSKPVGKLETSLASLFGI